jgi:hypothetical protein
LERPGAGHAGYQDTHEQDGYKGQAAKRPSPATSPRRAHDDARIAMRCHLGPLSWSS